MAQLQKDIKLIRERYGCLKTPLALAIMRVCEFGESRAGKCVWKYDEDVNLWNTECGHKQYFLEEGIEENEYGYCPFCGKLILERGVKNET